MRAMDRGFGEGWEVDLDIVGWEGVVVRFNALKEWRLFENNGNSFKGIFDIDNAGYKHATYHRFA